MKQLHRIMKLLNLLQRIETADSGVNASQVHYKIYKFKSALLVLTFLETPESG